MRKLSLYFFIFVFFISALLPIGLIAATCQECGHEQASYYTKCEKCGKYIYPPSSRGQVRLVPLGSSKDIPSFKPSSSTRIFRNFKGGNAKSKVFFVIGGIIIAIGAFIFFDHPFIGISIIVIGLLIIFMGAIAAEQEEKKKKCLQKAKTKLKTPVTPANVAFTEQKTNNTQSPQNKNVQPHKGGNRPTRVSSSPNFQTTKGMEQTPLDLNNNGIYSNRVSQEKANNDTQRKIKELQFQQQNKSSENTAGNTSINTGVTSTNNGNAINASNMHSPQQTSRDSLNLARNSSVLHQQNLTPSDGLKWFNEGVFFCNGNDGRKIDYRKAEECFKVAKECGIKEAEEWLIFLKKTFPRK